ncbi:MAG: hypothetical protein JNK43_04325 [Ignavibacteria bacterium]|nr:hypothetical protein [Ignavibacteria bacterium]
MIRIAKFFKSFRNKALVAAGLIIIAGALLLSKYVLKSDETGPRTEDTDVLGITNDEKTLNTPAVKEQFAAGIDSVLSNFGIKKEWISSPGENKNPKQKDKTPQAESEWFTKNVMIPNDLSTIEVNADVTAYCKSVGLETSANEDIITKDISLLITRPDTNKSKLPLAKINITHSDKIKRETAMFCVIINNITDYKPEDVDRLIINKNEFSYVFPRNLDDIDIQNKMLHSKKDILINLSVGAGGNYDTDFNSSMDEKTIRERVKSFTTDFPTFGTVILYKAEADVQPQVIETIAAEFSKYNIRVIKDSELTQMLSKAEEESKDKYSVLAANMKNRAAQSRSFVTMISVDKDSFTGFYDEIMRLKKLGYRFYSFTDFISKRSEFEKQEQEQQEKLKAEKLKLDKQKHDEKKKTDDKNQKDKKSADKDSQKKKVTDKKKTENVKKDTKKTDVKKKTDIKKKTDVKKK